MTATPPADLEALEKELLLKAWQSSNRRNAAGGLSRPSDHVCWRAAQEIKRLRAISVSLASDGVRDMALLLLRDFVDGRGCQPGYVRTDTLAAATAFLAECSPTRSALAKGAEADV